MYRYNRPKQCSECVGSLHSAMLEKLRPAPLLGTEAKGSLRLESLTACACGERPCVCGLTLTPPARGTQLSPQPSRGPDQPTISLVLYTPPTVPQYYLSHLDLHYHARSLEAHVYTTLIKLDSLLQLNKGTGAGSDPPNPKSAPCLPCPEQQRSQEDSAPETRQHRT